MSEPVELIFDAAPPSANKIWRTYAGKNVLSEEAKDFYRLVRFQLAGKRVPEDWNYYKVELVVEPRIKSGDVDNRIKPVLDALSKAGFWSDDKRVAFVSCQFGKINKRGRTIVRVSERKEKYGYVGECF